MLEITIKINRQDIIDWLNGDEPHPRVGELADLYAQELANRMTQLNPTMAISVELCETYDHTISVDGLTDWEQEHDRLESLELDYQAVCDRIVLSGPLFHTGRFYTWKLRLHSFTQNLRQWQTQIVVMKSSSG